MNILISIISIITVIISLLSLFNSWKATKIAKESMEHNRKKDTDVEKQIKEDELAVLKNIKDMIEIKYNSLKKNYGKDDKVDKISLMFNNQSYMEEFNKHTDILSNSRRINVESLIKNIGGTYSSWNKCKNDFEETITGFNTLIGNLKKEMDELK
jgi:hypothetical protein